MVLMSSTLERGGVRRQGGPPGTGTAALDLSTFSTPAQDRSISSEHPRIFPSTPKNTPSTCSP